MSNVSEQKKKFLESLKRIRKIIQLEIINDEDIKLVHTFLHHEVAKLFETFFILTRLNNFPFSMINKEYHRFILYLYLSLRDCLLLSLNRILIDSKPDCWTLTKYENLIRSQVPKELQIEFNATLQNIEFMPIENKQKIMKAIRDCKISHNIPDKKLRPDEIGELNWEDIELFVHSVLEKFRLFDSMFSSISMPAFNMNYFDDYYERRKTEIHDVDCFIIDYLERHFPGVLETSIEDIRKYPSELFNDISDTDINKIEFLQSLVKQAKDKKQNSKNIHLFLMNQLNEQIQNRDTPLRD